VSSSNKRITLEVGEGGEPLNYPTPRKLASEEIPQIVNDFRLAARNAIDAGN
jgi:12-oxophytodienoic acid reductase